MIKFVLRPIGLMKKNVRVNPPTNFETRLTGPTATVFTQQACGKVPRSPQAPRSLWSEKRIGVQRISQRFLKLANGLFLSRNIEKEIRGRHDLQPTFFQSLIDETRHLAER